ncbi:S-adenosyl-L-methionine-dependent methyltransferase [Catenaria anguillulae PL171]|uniref:S-adenosyl-L-methionine-dependent methyltransferase n=1 Tax=Catenaria anguillulae PL171 TaxID=765915 RepID=A0A1Y2HX51_9FUNG|nr:S-adenosyl-L-methionine-dependent methyltransferase [Catenaria anguillulae PL171]
MHRRLASACILVRRVLDCTTQALPFSTTSTQVRIMGKRGGKSGRGGKKSGNAAPKERQPKAYADIPLTNERFETYYQAQNIIPDPQEWESFLAAFRKPLPVTFRFTGSSSYAKALAASCHTKYFPSMQNVTMDDGTQIDPPKPLAWYPDQLAYQYAVDRATIRKHEGFRRFHQFLTAETEIGNLSRQEAVSMIPPLLLDVHPHHRVLDMCAAPGSKTAQLIEAVHGANAHGMSSGNSGGPAAGGAGASLESLPDGLVVANDADWKRAYMLVHQTKRLQSPCLMITNHEAQFFPHIYDPVSDKPLLFDRILADVPCSGDGTLRKNVNIWKDWTVGQSLALHILQLRILMRAVALTKVGGKIVYSTCSLNPVENEAVVQAALKRCGGALRIVDASSMLPELKRAPGLKAWKVPSFKNKTDNVLYSTYDEIPEDEKVRLIPSMFSTSADEADALQLEHCLRIYPHLQNTGGFFVAVLEKVGEPDLAGKTQYGELPEDFPAKMPKGRRGGAAKKEAIAKAEAKAAAGGAEALAEDETDAMETDEAAAGGVKRKAEEELTDEQPAAKHPRLDQEEEQDEQSMLSSVSKADVTLRRVPSIADSESTSRAETPAPLATSSDVAGTDRSASATPTPVAGADRQTHHNFSSREEPFIFLNKDDKELRVIMDTFGFPENFPVDQLVVRSTKEDHRAIYFTSASVKQTLVANNAYRIKVVNTGVKVFTRRADASETQKVKAAAKAAELGEDALSTEVGDDDCTHRFNTLGLPLVGPLLTKRVVKIDEPSLVQMLLEERPLLADIPSETVRKAIAEVPVGPAVATIPDPNGAGDMWFSMWRAPVSTGLLVNKKERVSLLNRLGVAVPEKFGGVKKYEKQAQEAEAAEVESKGAEADGEESVTASVAGSEM